MLTTLLAVLLAGSAGAATDTFTSTATATNTATSTSTDMATATQTSTATATATSTSTPTSTTSRTSTSTRTSTATRTSTRTLTFTRTFTFTPTATSTPTFTRTSTPSFTITNTGTPSGQKIKLGQVEGFLTAVPTSPPGATSADLFILLKQYAAQFERIAHPGIEGSWYDDPIHQQTLVFHIEDTGNVIVGGTYVQWQFPYKIRLRSVDYYAITASGGGGSETFEMLDGTNSFTFAVASGTTFAHATSDTQMLPSPVSTKFNRNASTVGTTAAKVTVVFFYVKE